MVGYCVVTPGGRRLKCSTAQDVIIGPYYVYPEYRGKNLSILLVSETLKHCSYKYDYAYDWIYNQNTPSIRCSKACGFEEFGHLDVVGRFRRLVMNPNGSFIVFRKPR